MADNESNEDENDIGPFGTNRDNLDALARHALRRLDNEKRTQVDVTDYPELIGHLFPKFWLRLNRPPREVKREHTGR
jgi:hypothetical protein